MNGPRALVRIKKSAALMLLAAICLRFNDRIQVSIYLLSSVASAYILYGWLFLFATSVEIGGVIASASWLLLFYVSCATIFSQWRLKKT